MTTYVVDRRDRVAQCVAPTYCVPAEDRDRYIVLDAPTADAAIRLALGDSTVADIPPLGFSRYRWNGRGQR